jgi:cyclase
MKSQLKKSAVVLLMLVFGHVPSIHAGQTIPAPDIKKINEQVYALLGPVGFPSKKNRGYMVNSAVIIGDKGVILVDTGFTNEIGRHLKKIIASITKKPVTHVINTHHHGDHVLGNSEFEGAEIISTEKCRELVNKVGYQWIATVENITGYKFPNTKPVAATTVYQENTRTTVTLQGVTMELIVPGGSHTPGDMMIYIPKYRLLVSGDILVNTMTPSFVDAHVKTWIGTLEDISSMAIDTIIPGHGPLMKLDDVRAMHKRMAALYAGIESGYKQGLTDSEIRNTLDLSEWKNMVAFEGLMGMDINRTYLEVEEANF